MGLIFFLKDTFFGVLNVLEASELVTSMRFYRVEMKIYFCSNRSGVLKFWGQNSDFSEKHDGLENTLSLQCPSIIHLQLLSLSPNLRT